MVLSRKTACVFGLFVFAIAVLSVGSAHAFSSTSNSTTTQITTSSETVLNDTGTVSSRTRVSSEYVEKVVAENRATAENEVKVERKTRTTIDDDTRQQLCENRKNAIENKIKAYSSHASDYLDRLDSAYGKLATYLTAHPLEGVDMTAATSAQTAAAAKVLALQQVIGEGALDCSHLTDNATWLTQIRTAAKDAKTALKAYRAELKKMVNIIVQKNTSDQADNSSTQTDSVGTETQQGV